MTRYLVCLSFAIFFFSCSPSGQQGSTIFSNIINGSKSTLDDIGSRNAVGLFKGHKEQLTSFCSGSVIGHRHVLTASHCFNKISFSTIKVGFRNSNGEMFFREIERVDHAREELVNRYGFKGIERVNLGFNFDLALITLTDAIPEFSFPLSILPSDLEQKLVKGGKLILAGFGRTEKSGSATSQELYQTVVDIRSIHRSNLEKGVISYKNNDRITGACHGDSGGPAYAKIEGRWYLVGATVGEDGMLFEGEKPDCYSSQGIYTYLPAYIGWVNQKMNAAFEGQDFFDPFLFSREKESLGHNFDCESSSDLTLDRWIALYNYAHNVIGSSRCDRVLNHFATEEYLSERPENEKALLHGGWTPLGNYYFTSYFSNLKNVSLILGHRLRPNTVRNLGASSNYYYLRTYLDDLEFLPSSVERLTLKGGTVESLNFLEELQVRMEVDFDKVLFLE